MNLIKSLFTYVVKFVAKCLSSRKFMTAFGAILITIGTAVTGEITWNQALLGIIATALTYIGVEGAIDYQRAKLGK